MSDLVVADATVVGPRGMQANADLAVRNGRIEAVGPGAGAALPDAPRLDASGLFVWPGFIDLHIHGARGTVMPEQGVAGLRTVARALASHGVTRFLPTLPPMPPARLREEVRQLLAPPAGFDGSAAPLGLHLEGPFLNPERCGALSTEAFRPPDLGEFRSLVEEAGGGLRMMTLSPELPGAGAVIAEGRKRGVVMSAGHTEASFSEMEEAARRGLSHVTHCFNAMRRLSHRRPGPVAAALTLDGLTVDVICDGKHVHPPMIEVLFRCKGPERIALISDATAFQAKDGSLLFWDREVQVRRGVVRDTATGALGGSAISVLEGARNLFTWHDLDFPTLSRLASLNPARILGEESRLGSLEAGKAGDFFLADATLCVREVYREGKRIAP